MISMRKGAPSLTIVPNLPPLPTADVARIKVDARSIDFPRGSIRDAELAWFLDPRSDRLVSAEPVSYGGARLRLDGAGAEARHTIYLAGPGGWSVVTLDPLGHTVRAAAPRVDGTGIGFSETAWYCREASVIGYDRAVLTVRPPVGGALRVVPLELDVVHGTFDTTPYLGLVAGDRLKLELAGPEGAFTRELVFPKAADPWVTYSLDELTRS